GHNPERRLYFGAAPDDYEQASFCRRHAAALPDFRGVAKSAFCGAAIRFQGRRISRSPGISHATYPACERRAVDRAYRLLLGHQKSIEETHIEQTARA